MSGQHAVVPTCVIENLSAEVAYTPASASAEGIDQRLRGPDVFIHVSHARIIVDFSITSKVEISI